MLKESKEDSECSMSEPAPKISINQKITKLRKNPGGRVKVKYVIIKYKFNELESSRG